MTPIQIAQLLAYFVTQGMLTYVQVQKSITELRNQGALSQETADAIMADLMQTADEVRAKGGGAT